VNPLTSASPFHGVYVALLTPFDSADRIDVVALRSHIDALIRGGIDGVYAGGTTGEAPLLSMRERTELGAAVIAAVDKRIPVILQTGAATTEDSVALTRSARDQGAEAAAVVAPWYYRLADEALAAHFRKVAASAPDFPVLLYNIPQNTGNPLSPDLVLRVGSEAPNLVGIKDSSGDLRAIAELVRRTQPTFRVFSGSDPQMAEALELGAAGVVSGNANVVPGLFAAAYRAFRVGDAPALAVLAGAIQSVCVALGDGDIGMLKAVVARLGQPVGRPRSPIPAPSNRGVELAVEKLKSQGLLFWESQEMVG
jgi:4-hydroxy-tetrahydrodipicolinate synthase